MGLITDDLLREFPGAAPYMGELEKMERQLKLRIAQLEAEVKQKDERIRELEEKLPPLPRLEEIREKLLVLVNQSPGRNQADLAKLAGLNGDAARLHLEELQRNEYIMVHRFGGSEWAQEPPSTEWSLTAKGRAYLTNHDIVAPVSREPERAIKAARTFRLLTPEADPGQIKAWNAVFNDFSAKHNEIAIKGEFATWDDITKKLAADFAKGSLPEILAGGSKPEFVAEQVKRGLVMDLAPIVDALGRDDFDGDALRVWHHGGIQMAIPYGAQWPVLWYRKDLLAENGIKPPTTWDEYRAAAEKLTDPAKGLYGAVFSAGRNWNTHVMALIAVWSAGGLLFDEKLNVAFDSPETRRALAYYSEMAMRYSPPDVAQYGFHEAAAAFTSGKAATTFYWGRVLSQLYAEAPHLLSKTATIHIPRDRQYRTTLHFDEFSAYKTPNAKETMELIMFMLQPEQMIKILWPVAGHVIPTRKSMQALYARHPWLVDNPDIAKTLMTPIDFAISPTHESRNHPFNYKYSAVEEKNILPDCVQRIVVGKEPVNKAVAWAHKQMVEATKDIKA